VTNQTLTALSDASAQILDGITQLAEGAQAVQQNVSFSALKAIMAERGLDVDALRQNNSSAMSSLRSTIDEYQETANLMGFGELFASLEKIITLLSANNAFIDGTGAYLNAVNQNTIDLVAGAQQLKASYVQFDDAITKLVDGMGSLAENMGQLTAAVNTLVSEYQKLHTGISSYTGAVAEISAGYAQIVSGVAQLAANTTKLTDGASALYTGAGDLLGGITELYDGTQALSDGADKLDTGVAALLRGISQLFDGSSALEQGTSNMRDESDGIDNVISEKVDDILSGLTGGDHPLTSFVSEKNTNVESVQFVIRTDGVVASADANQGQVEEQPLTFWQKLLKLFGF
jgi:putative membrane protein